MYPYDFPDSRDNLDGSEMKTATELLFFIFQLAHSEDPDAASDQGLRGWPMSYYACKAILYKGNGGCWGR